jgi:hypothetical protein
MNKELTQQEVNKNRIEELERINKLRDIDEPQEHEEYREPLSVDTTIIKTILLSWGGPSDGFKLSFNQDKELIGGVYFMSDWGEYKESSLDDDEAEDVYNFYMGGCFE